MIVLCLLVIVLTPKFYVKVIVQELRGDIFRVQSHHVAESIQDCSTFATTNFLIHFCCDNNRKVSATHVLAVVK
jgi:hypothetical protein